MLKKCYRLTKRGSFTYVYNKGARASRPLLGLVFVPAKNLRIGFSVPNKVGKAVVRNLLKRRLRAYVRSILPQIRPAQIVITAKPDADKLTYSELTATVRELLLKAKLLKELTMDN